MRTNDDCLRMESFGTSGRKDPAFLTTGMRGNRKSRVKSDAAVRSRRIGRCDCAGNPFPRNKNKNRRDRTPLGVRSRRFPCQRALRQSRPALHLVFRRHELSFQLCPPGCGRGSSEDLTTPVGEVKESPERLFWVVHSQPLLSGARALRGFILDRTRRTASAVTPRPRSICR